MIITSNHIKQTPKKFDLLLLIALILIAIYVINCFTPLRLNNDTVRYLKIKEWIEAGRPPGDPAAKEFLPHGYVWFLLLLSRLHLATSFFFCLFQCCFLLGSLWYIQKIFSPFVQLRQLIILCLLNWSMLKFVLTPLSEMQFLFFSSGAIYFFQLAESRKKLLYLICTILYCAAAVFTRTIGILLPLAFLLTLLLKNTKAIKETVKQNKYMFLAVSAAVLFLIFFSGTAGINGYLREHRSFFEPLSRAPVHFILHTLQIHLIDWSALLLNIPAPKIPLASSFHAIITIIFLAAAILSLCWLVRYLYFRKNTIPAAVKIYLPLYGLVVFCWPLSEPRLWVPVLPFVMAILLEAFPGRKQFSGIFVGTWRLIYLLLGIAAIGYYSYTSFNKKTFAVKQDAAIWRNEYETWFFGKPLSDTAGTVRQPVLEILKKYN